LRDKHGSLRIRGNFIIPITEADEEFLSRLSEPQMQSLGIRVDLETGTMTVARQTAEDLLRATNPNKPGQTISG